jgi:hypothetical protein
MKILGITIGKRPDIRAIANQKDIPALIRLLDDPDFDIQWQAADALSSMGQAAVKPLLQVLEFGSIMAKVGAVEALADIRDPASVPSLMKVIASDETSELRWAAALACGEISDEQAVPVLVAALKDPDRYVRYGAAFALARIGWKPADESEKTFFFAGMQEWKAVQQIGKPAIPALSYLLKDRHPATRARIIGIIGGFGGSEAKDFCNRTLRDPDGSVRWTAVLASRKCGIPITRLPIELAQRPRSGPSPIGSAILNLLFFGQGYNYMGKWWGFLIFMSYMTLLVFAQLEMGPFAPFLFVYPITAIFAVQTYYMAKREAELAG